MCGPPVNRKEFVFIGVTIPSQRRYVEYFGMLVRSALRYRACALHVRALHMEPPPAFNGSQPAFELCVEQATSRLKVCAVQCTCTSSLARTRRHFRSYCAPRIMEPLYVQLNSELCTVNKNCSAVSVSLNACAPLSGDVRVSVFTKHKVMRKEKLFHFWFNTFFVANELDAVRIPSLPDSQFLYVLLYCTRLDSISCRSRARSASTFRSERRDVQALPEQVAVGRRAQGQKQQTLQFGLQGR